MKGFLMSFYGGTIQFKALENANFFKRFFSELAGDQEKLPKLPNSFVS